MAAAVCVLGCKAFIPGIGNAFRNLPKDVSRMAGDIKACRKTQFEVNEMRDIMYLARSTQVAIMPCWSCAAL